jgi:hypothetical protein
MAKAAEGEQEAAFEAAVIGCGVAQAKGVNKVSFTPPMATPAGLVL